MILKGKRRHSVPIIISENNESTLLQRISLTEKIFNESWLQELIHKNSSLIQIEDIEPSFADSFSIGREIKTNVGFIDNLFINQDGYITIIETKLWRNTQARREVVGQIIDYAKELTKWNYEDLNNAILLACNKSLIELVKLNADTNEIDEKYFIDSVAKNLKNGRLLLLIIGDGIHESVEEMADYLQQFAQINFTLALIELQVYLNLKDNSKLILPQTIIRTKEITRAIIKIESNLSKDINIDVQSNFEVNKDDKVKIYNTLTYDDFFSQLKENSNLEIVSFVKQIISDCESKGMLIELGKSSIGFKLIDDRNNKISIFFIDRKEFFYLWYIGNQLNNKGYNPGIGIRFAEDTADLFKVKLTYTDDFKCSWNKYLRIQDLQQNYNAFIKLLDKFIVDFNTEMKITNS